MVEAPPARGGQTDVLSSSMQSGIYRWWASMAGSATDCCSATTVFGGIARGVSNDDAIDCANSGVDGRGYSTTVGSGDVARGDSNDGIIGGADFK